MNRYIINSVKTGCLLVMVVMAGCGTQQSVVTSANKTEMNPLLAEWTGPFAAPRGK
ncbi:hypothetical protein [Daejeonella sp.]|uniref:hypothetical protein n=1 Tax=Daejeonella sp. TaxID=2805397 RepID=UPI0030C3A4B8